MASKLIVVNSNDRVSGTDFQFRYNFGDNLVNGNYDTCRLKFLDLNIETTGVNATTDGLASMGTLYCSAQLGQDSLAHDIIGYNKYYQGRADGYYRLLTPNPITHIIPVIKGIVEFKLLDEDFEVMTGANVNGVTFIFQIEFFNKQELSDAVGDSMFARH